MKSMRINSRVFSDVGWWHWALTVPMLVGHLTGCPWSMPIAMALCAAMCGYSLLRTRSAQSMAVQVRLAYLGLLLIGLAPAMHWMHPVQLVGTTAMVAAGYCPLARMLSLVRGNRTEPFTLSLLHRTALAPPTGGLLRRLSNQADLHPSCSCRSGLHSVCA